MDIEEIKQQLSAFASDLPSPLSVLVQFTEGTEHRERKFTAICMEYPVRGYALNVKEVVLTVLNNLVNYLHQCETKEIAARHDASKMYRDAFKKGIPMPELAEELDLKVHTTKAVAKVIKVEVRAEAELVA